jgi:hypothetical protein
MKYHLQIEVEPENDNHHIYDYYLSEKPTYGQVEQFVSRKFSDEIQDENVHLTWDMFEMKETKI